MFERLKIHVKPNLPPWLQGLKRPAKIGATAALITALIALFTPNYYQSEARILPVDPKGGSTFGGMAAAAAAMGVDTPGGGGPDANFVDILNSRTLREQLLDTEFAFHTRSWRFGVDRLRRQTLFAYLKGKNQDRAIKKLKDVLSVSRDIKSKLITLTAETPSPELSQKIAERCLQLLDTFVQQKGRTRGGAKALFVEGRLQAAQNERAEAEEALRAFLNVNRNYLASPDPTVRLKGIRLESDYKLRDQLVINLALAREQALLEEKNDVPIVNVLDSGNLPIEKSSPARSIIVVLAFLLVSLSAWAWQNRAWIQAYFLGDDAAIPPNHQD